VSPGASPRWNSDISQPTLNTMSTPSSLTFLLVGAVILIPTILAYTGYAYWVFRGKVDPEKGYH
jgi:cytochrome bd-type quinol oxidase subunit 2